MDTNKLNESTHEIEMYELNGMTIHEFYDKLYDQTVKEFSKFVDEEVKATLQNDSVVGYNEHSIDDLIKFCDNKREAYVGEARVLLNDYNFKYESSEVTLNLDIASFYGQIISKLEKLKSYEEKEKLKDFEKTCSTCKKNETDTEGNTGLVIICQKIATTMKYSYFVSDEFLKENEPEAYQYFVEIMKSYIKSKEIYVDYLEKFILGMKHFIKEEPVYRLNSRISSINFEISYGQDVILQFFCPELNNYVTIVVRIYMNNTWRDIL
jgi:hypothetical protein